MAKDIKKEMADIQDTGKNKCFLFGYRKEEIHGMGMRAIILYFFLAFQECLPQIFSG